MRMAWDVHYLRVMGTIEAQNSGVLRLVNAGRGAESTLSHRVNAVERANRSAVALSEDDARLIFALRAADALEGGRSALLVPENRTRLMHQARRMGLREFDASLIIAIVQDRARHNPASCKTGVNSLLTLIKGAGQPKPEQKWSIGYSALLACVLAGMFWLMLVMAVLAAGH